MFWGLRHHIFVFSAPPDVYVCMCVCVYRLLFVCTLSACWCIHLYVCACMSV